jgi:hypothetical protein
MKFKYFDNKDNHKLIFEINAPNISVADKAVYDALGIKVEKCPHIGCQVFEENN